MFNLKDKLPKWEIHDNDGNLTNARELPEKSITNEIMADKFVSTLHHTEGYMKALDNKMLLMLFMKYMGSLADYCIEKSKSDKVWDSTYNTGIVYLLDNLLTRYSDIFETHGIITDYAGQCEIKELYSDTIKNAHIVIDDREVTNPAIIGLCIYKPEIRANSAGFKALIPHYKDEQFIETLKTYLTNCGYSSDRTNFWFIISEFIRRRENKEI